MTTAHLETTHSALAPRRTDRAVRLAPPREDNRTDAVVLDLDASRADQRDDRLVAGQRQRLDDRSRGLCQLLGRRPDLRGAHAPADLALDGLFSGI